MSSMEQSLPTLPLTKVTGGGGRGWWGGMGDENVKVESEEWGRGNKLGYERKHFWAQSFKIIKRGSQ